MWTMSHTWNVLMINLVDEAHVSGDLTISPYTELFTIMRRAYVSFFCSEWIFITTFAIETKETCYLYQNIVFRLRLPCFHKWIA